jgi:hypothetical protein
MVDDAHTLPMLRALSAKLAVLQIARTVLVVRMAAEGSAGTAPMGRGALEVCALVRPEVLALPLRTL